MIEKKKEFSQVFFPDKKRVIKFSSYFDPKTSLRIRWKTKKTTFWPKKPKNDCFYQISNTNISLQKIPILLLLFLKKSWDVPHSEFFSKNKFLPIIFSIKPHCEFEKVQNRNFSNFYMNSQWDFEVATNFFFFIFFLN